MLGENEGNMVFSLVSDVFSVILIESGTLHSKKVGRRWLLCNIMLWLYVWYLSCPQRSV
jgi:hypothetical protein